MYAMGNDHFEDNIKLSFLERLSSSQRVFYWYEFQRLKTWSQTPCRRSRERPFRHEAQGLQRHGTYFGDTSAPPPHCRVYLLHEQYRASNAISSCCFIYIYKNLRSYSKFNLPHFQAIEYFYCQNLNLFPKLTWIEHVVYTHVSFQHTPLWTDRRTHHLSVRHTTWSFTWSPVYPTLYNRWTHHL